jgi:hypothetical protein
LHLAAELGGGAAAVPVRREWRLCFVISGMTTLLFPRPAGLSRLAMSDLILALL